MEVEILTTNTFKLVQANDKAETTFRYLQFRYRCQYTNETKQLGIVSSKNG